MSSSQSKRRAQEWVDSQDPQASEWIDSTQNSRVRSRSSVSEGRFHNNESPAAKRVRLREQTQDLDERSSISLKTAATTPSVSTEFVWKPSEIQVGTYKWCSKVAIFAKLSNAKIPAVLFRIDLREADRVSNIKFVKEMMSYDQVNFAPEFNQSSPAATRALIKDKFTRVPKTEPAKAAELNQYTEASSSSGIGVRNMNEPSGLPCKASPTLAANPASVPLPPSPINPSTIRREQRQSLTSVFSDFEERLTGEIKNAQDALLGIDDGLIGEINKQERLHQANRSQVIQHYEQRCAELIENNIAQQRIIDEYKRRYGDLSNPIPGLMNNHTNGQPNTSLSVQRNGTKPVCPSNLDMRRFEVIDENRANGGMMTEKMARRVMYEGKWFEETIVVEELIIYKAKGIWNGTTAIDGRLFTTFAQRDGTFRYLESPTSGNVGIATADGGRMFAKWTLLKPISVSEDLDCHEQ